MSLIRDLTEAERVAKDLNFLYAFNEDSNATETFYFLFESPRLANA